MKIIIAPDKFKHSLSSLQASTAIKEGVLKAIKNPSITILPMADGGDGLLEILTHYTSATGKVAFASDPLFRKIKSSYLISDDKKTAFIEMAKASGLMLLKPEEFNCMKTSSFGIGELIKDAINQNVSKIIIGIGGSATNDGGIGMAAALGYRFLDKDGNELTPTGRNLIRIAHIDSSACIDLKNIDFEIACDVDNPLTGENGASKVYAPQKGANPNMVLELEEGMLHYAEVIKDFVGREIKEIPGSGAAGGLGAGCIAFLNAKLRSGIDLVFEYSEAEKHIKEADLVISGEGKLDEQSLNGKVISGLAALCAKYSKPLIALCGKVELSEKQLKEAGIAIAISINPEGEELKDIYKNAYSALATAAENYFKRCC